MQNVAMFTKKSDPMYVSPHLILYNFDTYNLLCWQTTYVLATYNRYTNK